MTLPVSSYEELLDQVRELTNETILLQEQLSSDLQDSVEPGDVNHNLALVQKNYERGLELADSVKKQCEKTELLEPSQTLLPFEKYTQTLPARLSGSLSSGFKIPPGDPSSRLIAWRNKNRHLFAQDGQQQQQQNSSGNLGLSSRDPCERRRPLSLHGPREEQLLFGGGFAHSASLQFGAPTERREQQPMLGSSDASGAASSCTTSAASSSPRPIRPASSGDYSPERASSAVSAPETYTRSRRSYELDGSSTEDDSRPNSSLQSQRLSTSSGTWPVKQDLWGSSQSAGLPAQPTGSTIHNDLTSVMSFTSSAGISPSSGMQGQRRLSAKMDVVYSLLSMLSSTEGREDMSATLLSMSNSVDSCLVMRQSGCFPLLIQLIHAPGQDPETRERASRALYNIVHAKNDEKSSRREVRVLRLLEQLRDYCQTLRSTLDTRQTPDDLERHPGATIAALMKLSFDEAHRHAMCQLGGLHAVAELIEMDHAAHGTDSDDQNCITLRRYAGMALTNLTFGDGNNKALLCSFRDFMKALVSQLRSPSDDLRQVTASVLRNLSWRADSSSKQTLREIGAVVGLIKAAMEGRKESTLKSVLSALWNLSAHCSTNKMDICAVEGALAFLVDMLSYNAPSKTLAIVENAGGILRNVSSHIAVRDDYRAIVRERGCLQVLLRQLRSPSLTVVSNACGALWNLSARCPQDQRLLWDLGAVPMLRSLVHSKHRMISMGSSAALKNLLSARPNGSNLVQLDSTARGLGLPSLPSLMARRQKALEQEIDQNLTETCDNIEPSTSPVNKEEKFFKLDQSFLSTSSRSGKSFNQAQFHPSIVGQPGPSGLKLSVGFTRSESKESMRSVTSTQSDTIFEKVNRQARNGMSPSELQIKQQSASLHSAVNFDTRSSATGHSKGLTEKKYTLRYMNAIPERLKPGEPLPDLRGLKYAPSTISWASASNQDASCSKGLLHSSIEDTLSMTNSCDSSNSKMGVDSESGSSNFLATRAKLTSSFNNVTNYNLPLKSVQKIISPMEDPFNDYAVTNLDQPTDYSLRYAEHTSDDDKQSSAYFTSTEQEQDTIKTYCTEGTPYQGSLNSSRASSASDIHEEPRSRAHFKKISESAQRGSNGSKHFNANVIATQINGRVSSRMDSLRSTTTSESTLTLEAGRSLESDSAIFEGDHKLGESSGVPSLSSLVEDEPKIVDYSKGIKLGSMQYEADTESFPESMGNISDANEEDCLQNTRLRQSIRRNSYDEDSHSENNLIRYKTNTSLNDIETQDVNDDAIAGNQPTLTSLESIDQQQLQDDGDYSEMTYTNDYYTVEETYTLHKDGQKAFLNDDNSISQQCSETLTYMSIDDRDSRSNMRNEVELTENLTENMQTAASNSESCDSFDSIERSEQALLELCIKSGIPKPETLLSNGSNAASKSRTSENVIETPKQTAVSTNDICKSLPQMGKGTGKSQEEYRRQRDPDAMIASLDRLTATLVQQTEAMRERDSSAMKVSLLSDTWNEDSPNEVSFPSISVSAPLVASFKSDLQDDQVIGSTELAEEDCSIPRSMTESRIIEIEAIKLAEAVSAEANQISLASIDLDAINPPSTMGSLVSLTASIGGMTENGDNSGERSRCYSTSLPPMQLSGGRKKSLPIGVVARRALSNAQTRTGSLENLLNECNSGNHSQLENVKPPSIMDELLDVGDMENSMLSVASITSEIADTKENYSNSLTNSDMVFELIKPVANVLSMTCMRYAETMQGSANNSLSECLENINPPSLFNEVSQMDETTMEANTHCSDTLCIDGDLCSEEATHCAFDERIEEIANDTDDGATPISSEYCSSVESTPKKRFNKNHPGQLTPKQKRQLAKERYKTYTIAAERVKKEQEDRRKQEQANENNFKNLAGKISPFSKLTPKQRRQEDRARFQTQVLETPTVNNTEVSNVQENEVPKTPNTEKQSLVKSGIPMLRKFGSGSKTFRINRNSDESNKEKQRAKIFSDEGTSGECYEEHETSTVCSDEMQNVNERNANIILNTEAGNKNVSPVFNYENGTNLISVESRIEQTMQIKFMNGVSKKLSHVYNGETAQAYFTDATETTNENLILENQDDFDESQSESDEDSSEREERHKFKGPRIVKPGAFSRDESVESNATDKSEPEVPKGIRGRRKPLYSMPNTRKSTPQTSPLKQPSAVSRSNTTPIVRATRATTLRQNNSFQKTNAAPKLNANASGAPTNVVRRSSIPQKASTATFTKTSKRFSGPSSGSDTTQKVETPVKSLERQGTFTKDEPEMENAPMVMPMSPYKGSFVKPVNSTSKISPKMSPVHGKSKISLRTPQRPNSSKLTKTTSAEKISTPTNIPTIAKRSSTNLCGPVVKSSSNYQIAPINESGIPRKISLGQRSNSNSSIVSNASTQGTRTKMVKEATSKIASLWKKVEENKNKRFEKADTRQWITPNRDPTHIDPPNGDKEQNGRMFRSSTFEGITQESEDQGLISPSGKVTTV